MAATAMAATVPQRNFFIIFFPLSCRPGACAGLRPNTCTVLVGAPGGHRCLPFRLVSARGQAAGESSDRRNRSEEHTSELQSLMRISYAVFCLKKKKINKEHNTQHSNTKS